MNEQVFKTVVIVALPGDVFVNYVVRDDGTQTEIDTQLPEGIPPAAAALALAQLLSAILPAGIAGFHAWKALAEIRGRFSEINDQMANVPTVSGDELPF